MKLLIILWLLGLCICLAASGRHRVDYCRSKCPLFDPVSGPVYLPGPTKRHYYKCSHGVGIMFICDRRSQFNPELQVCDLSKHSGAVKCKGSPNYVAEGSGDGFWEHSRH